MIVSVHQPNYLPYLGFFHKAAQSDIFISYDTAQFSKNDFHNRNKVKTTHGWTWLTVPVRKPLKRQMREIEIDNSKDWRREHILTIKSCYSRAPCYADHIPYFEDVYSRHWERLAELNEGILNHFFRVLCPHVRFARASDLHVPNHLNPTEKIIWMVKSVGGSTYLSGPFGRQYLDERKFTDVRLTYQEFQHPTYQQRFGDFIQNLSLVDSLFNIGEDSLRRVLGKPQPASPLTESHSQGSLL